MKGVEKFVILFLSPIMHISESTPANKQKHQTERRKSFVRSAFYLATFVYGLAIRVPVITINSKERI